MSKLVTCLFANSRPLKPNLVADVVIHIMNIINAGPLRMLSTYDAPDVWVERLGT